MSRRIVHKQDRFPAAQRPAFVTFALLCTLLTVDRPADAADEFGDRDAAQTQAERDADPAPTTFDLHLAVHPMATGETEPAADELGLTLDFDEPTVAPNTGPAAKPAPKAVLIPVRPALSIGGMMLAVLVPALRNRRLRRLLR